MIALGALAGNLIVVAVLAARERAARDDVVP